jgi:SWI/SNF-related matrix-associated actin-dependent regulator 1 of chromatin subfamily A
MLKGGGKGGKGGGGGKGKGGCVDLTSIKNSNNGSKDNAILCDADFATFCPDLVLKGYQLVGVNWLKLLHQNDVNGVLADDMGLGKTIQTIAFLGWLDNSNSIKGRKTRPHLIVVPASVLSNWQNELERFCPSLNVMTYHGSQNERSDMRYDTLIYYTLSIHIYTYTNTIYIYTNTYILIHIY